MDISVILPTRNRATQLQGALEHLVAQETRGAFTYEVLIVDNGSTDATRQVVEARQPQFPVPLRYLYEGRAGRPWALNAGMAAAHGSVFAFTDDDILATPIWLAALWRCFQEEKAHGVGGKIVPSWTVPRPAWLTDEAVRQIGELGCLDHGSVRRTSANGSYCRWVGGNLAVRRTAVERVGPYDVRMTRGQDTEYFWRFMQAGLVVCYEPHALVYHQIGADRMTLEYFRQWRHRAGYYQVLLIPWKWSHLFTVMPLWRSKTTVKLIGRWIGSQLTRRPWMERFKAELLLREEFSAWGRRVRLWPRWWWAVLTGRSHLP